MATDDKSPIARDGNPQPDKIEKKEEADAVLPEQSEETLGVLKEFDTNELLEVEEMPESNELQERRKKTKNRLKELSEVESSLDEGSESMEEGGIMDILKEANLSGRHVKFCCSGVLVIGLLVLLIFGGMRGFDYLKNRSGTGTNEVTGEDNGEESNQVYQSTDASIWVAVLIGQKEETYDSAVSSGEEIGINSSNSSELAQKIDDFAKVYESMQVDVNELLDQSYDRRGTLESYITELKYMSSLCDNNLLELNAQTQSLSTLINTVDAEKSTSESKFFAQMNELDAYATAGALEDFVIKSQELVRLKAEYQARKKLISYYESVLEDLSNRITDLELNREALVLGIQVIEVSGSDLNLIIDESQL